MTVTQHAGGGAAAELDRLHRCLGSVIALSALPAIWVRVDPAGVCEGLVDALLRTVDVDFVYVRLRHPAAGGPLSVLRTVETGVDEGRLAALQEGVDAWLEGDEGARTATIALPGGTGSARVTAMTLGHEPQVGTLVAGCRRREFPAEEDRVLLGVAANQAAVVLQSLAARRELSRSEQQLELERSRLREVFKLAPAFIATLRGPQHVFETANPAYLRIVGHREILGRPARQALPEVDGQGYFELLDQVYRTGEPFVGTEMRVQVAREAGGPLDELFVDFVYQPLRQEDGSVSGIFVHGVDVTEQVRARQRAEELGQVNRTITENASAALFMMDAAGCCTYLNPAAEAMTGYSLEELRHIPLHEAIHHSYPDGREYPLEECPIDRALPDGSELRACEDLFFRKDGTCFPVSVSARPIVRDGAALGTVLEVRDITNEKRAQVALQESEGRFRHLADAMPQIVWMARPDGYLDYYNRRWYEFSGFPEGEGGDESWKPILHPDDVQPCLDAWYGSVRSGEPYVIEYRFWDRGREQYRWHLGRALPVRDEEGGIVRWFGTCTDIDDQKRAAERLEEETHTVETINRVGRSLAAELDIQKLVQAVTDAGTDLSGAEFGAFFYNVSDAQGESYTLYTLSGAPTSAFERFPMPRNTDVFGPTFAGRGVVRLADVTADPRYGHNAPYRGMPAGHLPVRSYLAVPVISRSGEVVGGLFFGHREKGVFGERAERLVVGIAAQAAVAIDNARLYERVTAELAERKRAEALLTDQKGLLEQVARGALLDETLAALARMVETRSGGFLCSILLLDADDRLRHAAAPSLPTSYTDAIDGIRIGPVVGSCGTAAYRGEPVVVADIAADPLWEDYRDLALAHGLRACWSTPIRSSAGAVLGTVAMYARQPGEPGPREVELTETATRMAGIAIERVRTEAALRESETLLRTIIETEPECVKLVDREGRLRLMNHAGLRMIEADCLEQVAGTCVYGLVSPECREGFEELNRRVFEGESGMLQFVLVGLKGSRRWMETHAVPLRNQEGMITAQLAVTRDISERKRYEEELARRAAELAERDREKDEFLAMLAHELRNPLAPILNATQVLHARGAQDPLLQRQSAVIDRQARHMAQLLDDLLDVSRITRGKIELRRQAVDLVAAVEQAVESARPLLADRRHQFSMCVPPASLPVLADPTRLHQVIGNLLSNATKYTDSGGRITLTLEQEEEWAVLRVADSGVGIDPEFLPRVFDLFAQGDRSLSRTESGLGIGLTMVRRLVELHGGTVAARSAGVGKGSEFTVYWPLAGQAAAESFGAAPTPVPARTRRRLLVVDDNRDAAETLADLASLWGHEVRTAHDGPEALRAIGEQPPDAVLLDISMPGMDGYAVARRLRSAPEYAGLFLIALTGYGQEQDRRRALDAGFDHHLTKPVDPASLRRVLDAF